MGNINPIRVRRKPKPGDPDFTFESNIPQEYQEPAEPQLPPDTTPTGLALRELPLNPAFTAQKMYSDIELSPEQKQAALAQSVSDISNLHPYPTLETPPESMYPKPSIKAALKEALMNRIPLAGPVIAQQRAQRRAWELSKIQAKNQALIEQYKREMPVYDKLIDKRIDQKYDEIKQQTREMGLRAIMPNAPPELIKMWSMGITVPSAYFQQKAKDPVMVTVNTPTGQVEVPGSLEKTTQTVAFRDPVSGQPISKIWGQDPELVNMRPFTQPEHREPVDATGRTQNMIFAKYATDVLKLPEGSAISEKQKGDALLWWEKLTKTEPQPPAPQYQAIEVPGAGTKILRIERDGRTSWLQTPEGGDAIKKGPLGTAERAKIFQAHNIVTSGEDILKQLKDKKLVREVVGVARGKWANLEAKVGMLTPEARHLYTSLKSYYALQPFLHGWRALSAAQEFEKAVGGLGQNPRAFEEAIRSLNDTADVFVKTGKAYGYDPLKDGPPEGVHSVGDIVLYQGKKHKVKAVDPKTGELELDPNPIP